MSDNVDKDGGKNSSLLEWSSRLPRLGANRLHIGSGAPILRRLSDAWRNALAGCLDRVREASAQGKIVADEHSML